MYAITGNKRKDGTHRRTYVCFNVKRSTGLCDQPPIDAEKVDTAIVAYLDDLFVDFGTFLEQLSRGADQHREAVQAALDAALEELDRLDGNAGKHEADYARQIEAGDEMRAKLAARNMERIERERHGVKRRIEECQRELAEMEDRPVNAALDTFNDLRDALRGAEGRGLSRAKRAAADGV